jgi:hypothetical protein
VQRKAQRRNRTTEGSVELCQEGIERVQVCTGGTLFRVLRRRRSVTGKTLTELQNTLLAQQGVLE